MSLQVLSLLLIFLGSLSSWCKFLQFCGFFTVLDSKKKLSCRAKCVPNRPLNYAVQGNRAASLTDLLYKNFKQTDNTLSLSSLFLNSVFPIIGKGRRKTERCGEFWKSSFMGLRAIVHLLLRRKILKRSNLPVWIYRAQESWPEDTKRADRSGVQCLEDHKGIQETGDMSQPPLSWSICLLVKAFADGLTGSLNLCWPKKVPLSMHMLPFAHRSGPISPGGQDKSRGSCLSYPCHIQIFQLLPFLPIAVVTSKPGHGYSCIWHKLLISVALL